MFKKLKIFLPFSFLILLIFILTSCNQNQNNNPTPPAAGPYLDQASPGTTPIIFAPNIIPQAAFAITFSPDGRECFYTRWLRDDINGIYTTKLTDGRWPAPTLASFSGTYMDMEAHITPDGNRMYFGSMRPLDGEPSDFLRTWYVENLGSSWSDPQPIESPLRNRSMMYPSVADNGNIYYTDLGEGNENEGIYVSRLVNGNYSEPVVVAENINSMSSPAHPFIAPDESYLIFDVVTAVANDVFYRDLYISIRNQDGTWSDPERLNNTINTNGVEMCPFVSRDGRYFFFSRWVEETGNSHIYWVNADF